MVKRANKPHDSVVAILKTSPETVVDGLAWKLGLILKIKKEATKRAFKNTIAASHKRSKQTVTLNH